MLKKLQEMSIDEKLASAKEYRASKDELSFIESYIAALQSNDEDAMRRFESFGESVRHCCMNLYTYKKQQEFGWMDFEFGEHGWAKRYDFFEEETIEFRHKKDKACAGNLVTVGRGPNGTWTYGYRYESNGGSGGFKGLSIYGTQFRTKAEASIAAMERISAWLQNRLDFKAKDMDANVDEAYVKSVLKSIVHQMEILKGKAPVQVNLFDAL